MLYYVAHSSADIDRARQMTHDLQLGDLENTYICPLLLLSNFGQGELGRSAIMDFKLDILSACDELIIASEVSDDMKSEIDFAQLVGMGVVGIENGTLRLFEK